MDASQPHFALTFGLRVAGKAITILLGGLTLTNAQTGLSQFQLFYAALVLMVLDGAIQEALAMLPSAVQEVEIKDLRADKTRLVAQMPKRSMRAGAAVATRPSKPAPKPLPKPHGKESEAS